MKYANNADDADDADDNTDADDDDDVGDFDSNWRVYLRLPWLSSAVSTGQPPPLSL